MGLRFEAIRPRTLPIATNVDDLIDEELGRRGFAGAVVSDLSNYPAAQPWKSRPPTKGPRKGGRRTGTLGRNWRIGRITRQRNRRSIEVVNRTDYAVHVQGPAWGPKNRRQTAEMKSRNWPNVSEVGQARWREFRPIIVRILEARDPRLRRPRFTR